MRAAVFAKTLQVVFNAGYRIGEGIQALPVRDRLRPEQLLLDIAVAGVQQGRGTCKRNHRKPATRLGEELWYARQMLMVPLGGNELDDRVLGLLKPRTRFADNQAMNLRDISGRQMALVALLVGCASNHASQCRLDVQQRPRHIHQRRIVGLLLALRQGFDHSDLIENDPTWLTEAQHSKRIGDLLERRLQCAKLDQTHAVAAYEQIQAVFDPNQLFTQCSHNRTHGAAIRARQLCAPFIDQSAIGQRIVQAVFSLQGPDARRLRRSLGDVEEQILGQFVRCCLVDSVRTLHNKPLELLVDLAQQIADRGAVGDSPTGQPLDDARRNLPQGAQRRIFAEHFQTREYPRHIAQVGG